MSDPKQAAQGSAAPVAVCMISFGFIYPHILSD